MERVIGGLKTFIAYFIFAGVVGGLMDVVLYPYGKISSVIGSIIGIVVAVMIYAFRRKK